MSDTGPAGIAECHLKAEYRAAPNDTRRAHGALEDRDVRKRLRSDMRKAFHWYLRDLLVAT